MDSIGDMDLLMSLINAEQNLEVSISNHAVTSIPQLNIMPQTANTTTYYSIPPKPRIRILEEPASQRFRYECESRTAAIPGVNSTPDKKTYPTIELDNISGDIVVIVSCVTATQPYRPHPHKLQGENCKDGICRVPIKGEPPFRIVFKNLGIQCVKKGAMDKSIAERISQNINPFKVNLNDLKDSKKIDLNKLRLCFEVYAKLPGSIKRVCDPIVSQVICQSNLTISTLCSCSARAVGGDDIILLCSKISGNDIKIRFFEKSVDDQLIWQDFGKYTAADIHKQTAIKFRTPPYWRQDIEEPVQVQIQLVREADNTASEPRRFDYYPNIPDTKSRKRSALNMLEYQQKLYEKRQREEVDIKNVSVMSTPLLDAWSSNVPQSNTSPMYTTQPDIKVFSVDQSPTYNNSHSPAFNIPMQPLTNPSNFNYNFEHNVAVNAQYSSPFNQFDNSNSSSNYDYNQQQFFNNNPLTEQQPMDDSIDTLLSSDIFSQICADLEMENLAISN